MLQPFSGFWGDLAKPIIGLAPMDGVTDFPCREIMACHGRPDVIFTEFTAAKGILHAPERLLRDLTYGEIERPVVAQLFGHDPDDFYRATAVVADLGFDGIDINMGCPAKKIVQQQAGAGLIRTPDLAREIIRAVAAVCGPRRIPYSVKTRLGYDSVVIESWIETLLACRPAVISIHGRTLKQMYKGAADWEAIGRGAHIACGSGTLILGSGDVHSLTEATRIIEQTGVDGVLIGRASIGNPWIFRRGFHADLALRVLTALEHARLYEATRGLKGFSSLGKHLAGYFRNFPDASALRVRACQARNVAELESILAPLLQSEGRAVA